MKTNMLRLEASSAFLHDLSGGSAEVNGWNGGGIRYGPLLGWSFLQGLQMTTSRGYVEPVISADEYAQIGSPPSRCSRGTSSFYQHSLLSTPRSYRRPL
jgi:hypothetical protein